MVTKTRDALFAPLLVAAFAAFAVSATVSPAWAEFANPRGVAVVIGNRDYEHRDVPDVTFAHRDADAFSRYVVEVLGYDPEHVLDLRDATRRELFDALGTRSDPRSLLWSYLDPDGGSDVVVFYSGHGVPGVNDGRGYLLPVDADPRAAEDDGYPIELLYRNVGGLGEARSVRVYLDACFSGGSHEGGLIRNASPVYVQASLPSGVAGKVTSLTAASGKQVASWDVEAGHGMFTHHLLDALYGGGDANDDGQVTAAEAKAYLGRHMTRAARRQHRRVQEASLMGRENVVLAKAPVGGFPSRRALDEADAEAEESKLGLTREQRLLVEEGLSSSGHDVGVADGLLDGRAREALGSWQESQGLVGTGYLTKQQSETLQALGKEARAVRVRKADDAAFARAKELHTESGYREYLSSYPSGRHASEARALLAEVTEPERVPGRKFRDCAGCPELVVVPSGTYKMGSPAGEEGRDDDEGPVHEVTFARPFAVGVHEVTRGEFARFVSSTGRSMGDSCRTYEGGEWEERSGRDWRSPGFSQTDAHPVVCVSWEDAKGYVGWLSRETGKEYRLLSESEWEYVARGGRRTARYWGESEGGQCRYANGADREAKRHNSGWTTVNCSDGHYRTAPVGSYEANGYKLHDVLGNVWEWVEDCWNGDYHGAPSDGSAWESGNCGTRVLRGGSWDYGPRILRSASRGRVSTGYRDNDGGFRVARTLD